MERSAIKMRPKPSSFIFFISGFLWSMTEFESQFNGLSHFLSTGSPGNPGPIIDYINFIGQFTNSED